MMHMLMFIYSWLAIILLVPNLAGGQEEQGNWEQETSQEQPTEDWRSWQWYMSDTAVSMNVKSAWQAGYTGKGVLVAVVDDGVKMNHPDLKSNFNITASYDFLDDQPITETRNPASHGTECAGIIAGENNTKCGVGVAFDAQISSIRLFNDKTRSTDQSEAYALSFNKDMVDIYSNSWGPGNIGAQVKGPGPKLKEALEIGTRLGRRGKGSIFVFAAGNGGTMGDSCAFNGYVNNIRTIAISGVNWDGSVPAYSEQCAAIMAVTYGQDVFQRGKFKSPLITATGANACADKFPGSSGTAAMASGIIALVLQANPKLTWRDIQHLIARSSRPLNPPISMRNLYRTSWKNNAARLRVSSHFGFGLMDAKKMIEYAEKWRSVPRQLSCEVKLHMSQLNSSRLVIPSRGDLDLTLLLKQDDCSIQYLEHMQVEVNLRYTRRGYLEMFAISPSGTQSKLLYSRMMDIFMGSKNLTNWQVTSLHYWGENPFGGWNITIRNARPRSYSEKGRVFSLKLILYGTKDDPLANNSHVDRKAKQIERVDIFRRQNEIPIHGGYSPWSYWNPCSRPCGEGIQQRYRSCNNPRPVNGGRDCSNLGKDTETRICNAHRCPVHGGYSAWGSWSQCNVTCGVGYQQRSRKCDNPAPAFGGRVCSGSSKQSKRCRLIACPSGVPIDGRYTKWSSWSPCTQPCGGGNQQRSRSCTNPPPSNGGRDCVRLGQVAESRRCNSQTCSACTNKAGDSRCQKWYISGSCTNPAVKSWCKKTCGGCQACRNIADDSLCKQWSKNGRGCAHRAISDLCKMTCESC